MSTLAKLIYDAMRIEAEQKLGTIHADLLIDLFKVGRTERHMWSVQQENGVRCLMLSSYAEEGGLSLSMPADEVLGMSSSELLEKVRKFI